MHQLSRLRVFIDLSRAQPWAPSEKKRSRQRIFVVSYHGGALGRIVRTSERQGISRPEIEATAVKEAEIANLQAEVSAACANGKTHCLRPC